jgi:hypothetical protein
MQPAELQITWNAEAAGLNQKLLQFVTLTSFLTPIYHLWTFGPRRLPLLPKAIDNYRDL